MNAQLPGSIEAANVDARAKSEALFSSEFPRDPAKYAASQDHAASASDWQEVAVLAEQQAERLKLLQAIVDQTPKADASTK
ncbi:MAG: hypothetical protein RL324_2130 [Verrucomicrobiota bacterium]